MTSKKDLQIASLLAVVLFITGLTCYAAFPPPAPNEPVRLMFHNAAGKVLFTHGVHNTEYDVSCLDCHHNIEDDEIYNCSECHEATGDESMPGRTDAFHAQCTGCHQDMGAGPVECNSCHAI
ncbi:Cytochrome c, class III family protein [Desulfamplus magnetovallimortis]|uniref:Cytochrome c, class III family protein n=1 Tax=Desulfamplus magnetovallimortis TaxID=1246637 RepID=A0A1W1H4Z7_9BACT|nr:cytochrome c3 family protein [Desulfamplus magnetovallimortis]SLM27526.1 Cytochrome c, class III family protein [Desulfamplus magnetovallimortis]